MFDFHALHYFASGLNGPTQTSTTNLSSTVAGSTIKNLIKSAGNWVIGLGMTGGGLMVGYHALMRNLSGGDQQADAHHLQSIKKVAVGTALVAGAGGLAHFVGHLF